MKKRSRTSVIRLLAAVGLPVFSLHCAAYGAQKVWNIDPDRSAVEFSVKHLVVSNVKGAFKKLHGTVDFDGKTLNKAVVDAVVETGSVDTQIQARDEHLRGKDVFDALQFPSITFKSQKVVPSADGSFSIFGTLSMHGISKDIVLNAKPLHAIEKDTDGRLRTSALATAELNRRDFGITVDKAIDHGGAVVGEKVKIALNIVLTTPNDAGSLGQTVQKQHIAR